MKLWKLRNLSLRGGAMAIVVAESREHALSLARTYGTKLAAEVGLQPAALTGWIAEAHVEEMPFSPGVVGWVDV